MTGAPRIAPRAPATRAPHQNVTLSSADQRVSAGMAR
jgi:hypothetical protein